MTKNQKLPLLSQAQKLTKTSFFVNFNYKAQYSVSESHTNLN